MSQLTVISDKEAWGKEYDYSSRQFEYRSAVRAVVVDANKVALIHAVKPNSYGLPGGGIEYQESVEVALKREILEETGAEVNNIDKLGEILEVRYKPHGEIGKIQLNHCYYAKVSKIVADPEFSGKEVENACKLIWVSLDEAVNLISNMGNNVEDFIKYAQIRDLAILDQRFPTV